MGDCLWTGKPSRYVTSQQGRLSLLPSVGRYNEYQLSGWVIIINGDGGCSFWQSVQADSQLKLSGLVLGRRPLGAIQHSSNEPGELSQWLCHDDITINIVVVIIIIIINTLIPCSRAYLYLRIKKPHECRDKSGVCRQELGILIEQAFCPAETWRTLFQLTEDFPY